MKQFLSLIVLLSFLFLLTGCDTYNPNEYASDLDASRDDGYQCGYDSGWSDGYDEGYNEACDLYRSDEQCSYSEGLTDAQIWAENFALKNSGLSPDDALYILYAYEHQEPLFDDKIPTQEDCKKAVASLRQFCEYFYGAHIYNQWYLHIAQHDKEVHLDDYPSDGEGLFSEDAVDIPGETIVDMILKPPDPTESNEEG